MIREKLENFGSNRLKLRANKLFAFPNKNQPELYALGFEDDLELIELRRKVLEVIGVENSEKFNPHITLLRKETLSPGFKESKELVEEVAPIDVRIDNFGLYESNPSKGMNSYKPIFVLELN